MSEIEVKFRHTANLFENAVQRKKPTGSSFPIAKNLSKLEGDQVGHRCIVSLIRVVLCSAALRIGTKAGHKVLNLENEKAHTGVASIGGSRLHGL